MAKISDVVKLKSGYANFVELKSAFEEAQENADRMAMYRPTKAHRHAFERICRGLYQPNDKKFYLLSGSFGTGKSHLCLMIANFLSRSSSDPEIAGFYENYAKLDPEKAKFLRNIRKDGQYLVAICDYHSGRHFEDVVMKAVFNGCEEKGLDTGVETEFNEAERQLVQWEEKSSKGGGRNFYEDFRRALERISPGLSVAQLRANLKNYDSEAMEKFQAAFREVTGGVEFQPKSGNLIPILKKMLRSPKFKRRFKGLAIFFDEFGFTLEKAAYSKDILQGFMETICKNEPNVLFVGCIHKDFKSYADRFSKADAAVMSARITQVDLLNEGIEEIIGAIVETDKDSQVWSDEIAPRTGIFDQLLPVCKTLNLFPWIENPNRLRERVLEDIYGVHPMALACLLKLSSEIGSDARSTFTFFSGDVGGAKGSYAEFIQEADLLLGVGKLNLYTVDRLYTFFERELSDKNPDLRDKQRQLVNGFHASMEALQKASKTEILGFMGIHDDDRVLLLKTILIYQLCQIPTNIENIQFGLYCLTKAEKKTVENNLKDLIKKGAVFYRKQSKTYELAASTGEDPYVLIERYMSNTKLHPKDTVAAFLEEAGAKLNLNYMEAKGYNLPFVEDKRFRTRFVQAKDLGPELWKEIQAEWEQNRGKPKTSFEGTLVYALCENESEIKIARDAANTITLNNVALAIPHQPQPFTETLLRVKACRYYLPPNEAEKISAQTESRLRDIFENPEDGYLPTLQRVLKAIRESSDACWYRRGGKILVDKPKQHHKPADMICEELFKKRCRIKHPDLNLCHDERWKTGKNTALKQAVAVLLEAERVLIDNGNPDNHGQKRYLEKVLLRGAGALRKTRVDGLVTYFECETDPERIHDDFPVLKELCERLANQGAGEAFAVWPYLEEMKAPPFGTGGTQLILAFAHIIRGYDESLIIYTDSTKMVEQPINSYNDLVRIISDPAPKEVFVIRKISPVQMTLVDLFAKAIKAPPLKHAEQRSVSSAFENLKTWWNTLPPVAKIIDLYDRDRRTRLSKLKNLLDGLSGNEDRFDFMLIQLPSIYMDLPVSNSIKEVDAKKIAEAFAEDAKLFNSGEQLAYSKVAQAICEIYGTEGDMVTCENVVTRWYMNLNPDQRLPLNYDHEEAEQLLRYLAKDSVKFNEKILKFIPSAYGLGPVSEWTSLHIQDYVAKLKQAKAEIDEVKPSVYKPNIRERKYEIQESQELLVKIPDGASALVFTEDGSDPKVSAKTKRVTTDLDLSTLLKDRPSLKIRIRAVDKQGNYSDDTIVELVNKDKQYDLQIEPSLFGDKEAKFRCPNDRAGLIAVIKSVIKYGVTANLLSASEAGDLEALLNDLSKASRG